MKTMILKIRIAVWNVKADQQELMQLIQNAEELKIDGILKGCPHIKLVDRPRKSPKEISLCYKVFNGRGIFIPMGVN